MQIRICVLALTLANLSQPAYWAGMKPVSLDEAHSLPVWRRPVALLFVTAMAMPIAFYAWYALLNNFVVEAAGFDGADIGLLHTIREIPVFWPCW